MSLQQVVIHQNYRLGMHGDHGGGRERFTLELHIHSTREQKAEVPQASVVEREQEQHHQRIALHRLINSGSQVLNTLCTQGLSEFVCLSAFLHPLMDPEVYLYILLTAWKATNQLLISMPLPARLMLNSSF